FFRHSIFCSTQRYLFTCFFILFFTNISSFFFFFFIITPPTEIYTLSLHDALPICRRVRARRRIARRSRASPPCQRPRSRARARSDRKSTRLNSSHLVISYAVFCLKKKKN